MYTLWKNETMFDENYQPSSIQEHKPLFSVDPIGAQNKTAESQDSAALDELPCNQSHKALFSVTQI